MLVKTSELTGPALDWAVQFILGLDYEIIDGLPVTGHIIFEKSGLGFDEVFTPSTNWAQGGPIIDRERISIRQWTNVPIVHAYMPQDDAPWASDGTSPLIAAMRCFCEYKLGDVVEVPDELL